MPRHEINARLTATGLLGISTLGNAGSQQRHDQRQMQKEEHNHKLELHTNHHHLPTRKHHSTTHTHPHRQPVRQQTQKETRNKRSHSQWSHEANGSRGAMTGACDESVRHAPIFCDFLRRSNLALKFWRRDVALSVLCRAQWGTGRATKKVSC